MIPNGTLVRFREARRHHCMGRVIASYHYSSDDVVVLLPVGADWPDWMTLSRAAGGHPEGYYTFQRSVEPVASPTDDMAPLAP